MLVAFLGADPATVGSLAMKKLVFLAVIVALGIVAARRLRDVTGDDAVLASR